MKNAKRRAVYTRTYRHLVLRMIPCTVCSKESTAQYGTAQHRTGGEKARHRIALRGAAVLSWAEPSREFNLCDSAMSCSSTNKPGGVSIW